MRRPVSEASAGRWSPRTATSVHVLASRSRPRSGATSKFGFSSHMLSAHGSPPATAERISSSAPIDQKPRSPMPYWP